jgi:hypothetical protein
MATNASKTIALRKKTPSGKSQLNGSQSLLGKKPPRPKAEPKVAGASRKKVAKKPRVLKKNSQADREHLEGALSNYVSLGEIPDFDEEGTQGHSQHNALVEEIRKRGALNTVILYRGSSFTPRQDALDPNRPAFISVTSNKKIAQHFAKLTSLGKVHTIPVGTVKAIRVNDYSFELPDQSEGYGFEYHDYEEEWLVGRDSFPATSN